MKVNQLLLRCYAEYKEDQWSVVCLDLCLAAQADTFEEVLKKLDGMLQDYVRDALVGEDKEFAADLLSRRAPFSQWMKYYWIKSLIQIGTLKDDFAKIFEEPLPLKPCH